VTPALTDFAAEVGTTGPVRVVGGRTQWLVGGMAPAGVREVTAPAGVVAHEPAEMVVRVRAGTTLEELRTALRAGGQDVALEADDPARATIGGILAVGHSGCRRLGRGPVRDTVLEVTAVSAAGEVIRAGAPLVKNVTGFDLCRLLVGSLGTLALLGEVVLRCSPRPEVESWWVGEEADPFGMAAGLYRPLSVLWDGTRTWVGLAGFAADVTAQAGAVLGSGFHPCEGPPPRPGPHRHSRPPKTLRDLPRETGTAGAGSGWLAEIGVGVVHTTPDMAARLPPRGRTDPTVRRLHEALKDRFDPEARLNPGRSVLAEVGTS
jgi:glycolate oxidase FAD binding subunit